MAVVTWKKKKKLCPISVSFPKHQSVLLCLSGGRLKNTGEQTIDDGKVQGRWREYD